jgi:alkaline phosphatase
MYADDPSTGLIDPLAMDAFLVGAVSTDSIVMNCDDSESNCTLDPYGFTDSASSATAYATGHDTITGRLSVDSEGIPMTTVLEEARAHGKSTGLVATSQITHATPAAFGSHVDDRGKQNEVANQYFDNQLQGRPMVDVMLGGGLNYMQREDRDLVSEFRQAGYEVALDRTGLLDMQSDQLLGLFAPTGMPQNWDRNDETPSLAEMTTVALQTLQRNPQGFFLLVEGSQVDWGGHDSSIPGVISEMEDFITAIEVVLDFAGSHDDTLVIILADHETGGMSLGRDGIYHWDPLPLSGMTATPAAMTADYLAGEESLSSIVAAGIAFELDDAETISLDATPREEEAAFEAVTELFNKRTVTGWSSSGHTGVDVPLYAFGPGSDRFRGVMQNEAVGRVLWEVFLPEQ